MCNLTEKSTFHCKFTQIYVQVELGLNMSCLGMTFYKPQILYLMHDGGIYTKDSQMVCDKKRILNNLQNLTLMYIKKIKVKNGTLILNLGSTFSVLFN